MDTFRVIPPFGGTGHWEGDGVHWEKSGSGYAQVDGDVWWELEETKDDGYDDPDVTVTSNMHVFDGEDTFNDFEVGDEFVIPPNTWTIDNKDSFTFKGEEVYYFDLSRVIEGQHHEILNDYWNTYIYRNLEWTKTNTDLIKRSHV